jgi:anaerobic magnesium-protoporphyrin IX monomethyl ester cyclase
MSQPCSPCSPVVLVGFEDQDNLGLRYLAATLRASGADVRMVGFSEDPAPVLAAVRDLNPVVVGFSLIFQYMVPRFEELLERLRAAGVNVHFTVGGHYASFEPAATLAAMPALDSIVRYEGEDTLVELATTLSSGGDWRAVPGLAFRGAESAMQTSAPRVGGKDLDAIPWPDRADLTYDPVRLDAAAILGSRGCPWRCSFCSIVTFYEGNGTKGRRFRDPIQIVDEIEFLHREKGTRILLWQDDDFLGGGRKAVEWAHAIARECVARGLHKNLRWKISARSDEIRPGVLEPLVEAGLCHVYMGVEAGNEHDLKDLNKLAKPDAHLQARDVLRELGVSFSFGFMLLQPWSTIKSVRQNLQFLRDFTDDGMAPAGFCRMLPYAGTPVETRLRNEGRLGPNDLTASYRFLDSRLDVLWDWAVPTFHERNHDARGSWNLLGLLLFEARLDLPDRRKDPMYLAMLEGLSALSSGLLVDTVEQALDHIEAHPDIESEDPFLLRLAEFHQREDARIRHDLQALVQQRQVREQRFLESVEERAPSP